MQTFDEFNATHADLVGLDSQIQENKEMDDDINEQIEAAYNQAQNMHEVELSDQVHSMPVVNALEKASASASPATLMKKRTVTTEGASVGNGCKCNGE